MIRASYIILALFCLFDASVCNADTIQISNGKSLLQLQTEAQKYSEEQLFDKELQTYVTMLPLLEREGDNNTIGEVYFKMGKISEVLGSTDDSYTYFVKAKNAFAQAAEISEERISNLIHLASLHAKKSSYTRCLELLNEGMTLATASENKVLRGIVLSGMAEYYTLTDDYKKAKEYVEESLNIAKEIENDKAIENSTLNLARIHIALEEFEEGRQLLKGFLTEKSSKIHRFYVHLLQAEIDLYTGKLENALHKNGIAMEVFQEDEFKEFWLGGIFQRAQIFEKKGRYDQAISLFENYKKEVTAKGQLDKTIDAWICFQKYI